MFPHQNVAMAHGMVTSIQQGAANSSPSPLAGGSLAAISGQEMDTVLSLHYCFSSGQDSLLKHILSTALTEVWFMLWGHLKAHALYFF